jgi:hypothetical protein
MPEFLHSFEAVNREAMKRIGRGLRRINAGRKEKKAEGRRQKAEGSKTEDRKQEARLGRFPCGKPMAYRAAA